MQHCHSDEKYSRMHQCGSSRRADVLTWMPLNLGDWRRPLVTAMRTELVFRLGGDLRRHRVSSK